jgi:hypothetical protein
MARRFRQKSPNVFGIRSLGTSRLPATPQRGEQPAPRDDLTRRPEQRRASGKRLGQPGDEARLVLEPLQQARQRLRVADGEVAGIVGAEQPDIAVHARAPARRRRLPRRSRWRRPRSETREPWRGSAPEAVARRRPARRPPRGSADRLPSRRARKRRARFVRYKSSRLRIVRASRVCDRAALGN